MRKSISGNSLGSFNVCQSSAWPCPVKCNQTLVNSFNEILLHISDSRQVFEVYETIPNPSLQKMDEIIKAAVNICTCVYILVGFFGYVAFSGQQFSGNILLNFSTSLVSDVIKTAFVLSIAFSFPLVIFPCRASLYSLLYRRVS